MSDIIFAGDAKAIDEVRPGTLTAYDASTTYTVTMGGKTISTVGTGGTTTTTATALAALLNAATQPEFAEVTWSSSTNTVIGTCDTAGVPFVATLTVSGGTGTVSDFTTTTACEGPSVVCANNFINASTGARALPVNSDTLYFQDSTVSLLYALEALSAVTVTALHIKASYTGEIGLAYIHDATTDYQEYRPRHFKIGATNCYIGEGGGDGSGRLQLNFSNVQTAVSITTSDTASDTNLNAIQIKGTHASNALTATGGTIDLAPDDDDTAVFTTVTIGGTANLRANRNSTLTTVTASGNAQAEIWVAATTVHVYGNATVTRQGSGAWTTANVYGTLTDLGSGTVTTMNIGSTGTVDNDSSTVSKTYTDTTVAEGYTLNDNNHRVTFTNAINPGKGDALKGLNIGRGRTILPGAP